MKSHARRRFGVKGLLALLGASALALAGCLAGMFNSAGTFSALIALLIAGYLIDRLMTWVTKKPLAWKNNEGA